MGFGGEQWIPEEKLEDPRGGSRWGRERRRALVFGGELG